MLIAHLSDVHFGRIAHPEIVELLVAEINARGVDLVVVSGDLTQRARRGQYQQARAMLDAFTAPTLVVPGNHDVYAYWYPLGRLFLPLRRYRRYITDDLTPTFEHGDVAVLGINSAYGWTIKGGRLRRQELDAIESYFSEVSASFKVLVVHHHLLQLQELGNHDVMRRAQQALRLASQVGVDLVLCGHLHVSHVEPVELDPAGHRLVIVSAGTATSNRGRGAHRQTNYYNVIDIGEVAFSIEEQRFDPEAGTFVAERTTRFERVPA